MLDNNAAGLSSVLKYEAYLENYGFEKILSGEEISTYCMDEYYIVTGKFCPQENVIQYVINVPNGKTIIEDTPSIADQEQEIQEESKDYAAIYEKFCSLVDSENYAEAIEYLNNEELPLDYLDTQAYFQYAQALTLYTETKFLTFDDIQEVVHILSEEVPENFKESAALISKIEGDLKTLVGSYICKRDSKYQYDAYYMTISENGDVTLGMGKQGKGMEAGYAQNFRLAYTNLENGSYYMLCLGQEKFDYCDYGINVFSDYLVLTKAWGKLGTGMYAGNYVKEA